MQTFLVAAVLLAIVTCLASAQFDPHRNRDGHHGGGPFGRPGFYHGRPGRGPHHNRPGDQHGRGNQPYILRNVRCTWGDLITPPGSPCTICFCIGGNTLSCGPAKNCTNGTTTRPSGNSTTVPPPGNSTTVAPPGNSSSSAPGSSSSGAPPGSSSSGAPPGTSTAPPTGSTAAG